MINKTVAGYTKGPWDLSGLKVLARVGNNSFEHIATVITLPCIGGSDDVAAQKASDMEQANARLIAAAPELLEALKEVEKHHIDINNRVGRPLERSFTLRIVRAAIDKAACGVCRAEAVNE